MTMRREILFIFIIFLFCFFVAEVALRAYYALESQDLVFDAQIFHRPSENPRIHHLLRPNLTIVRDDVVYTTNSFGLRDTREYSPQPLPGVHRILIIGDSVAFGSSVNQTAIFAEVLEELLGSSYEVLNFGVSGYATVNEVALLKEEGLSYHPDTVILTYVLNDAVADAVFDGDETRQFSSCRLNIFDLAVPCSLKRVLSSFALLRGVRDLFKNYDQEKDTYIAYHEDVQRWQYLEEQVADLEELSYEKNFRVIVLLVPIFSDFEHYPWLSLHTRLTEMFTSHGFTVLDLYPVFNSSSADSWRVASGDPWHPNALGHALIATTLAQHVTSFPT